MAVRGAQVPWRKLIVDDVPVVIARRLPGLLRHLPAILGPERVALLADTARVCFHAAAEFCSSRKARVWTRRHPYLINRIRPYSPNPIIMLCLPIRIDYLGLGEHRKPLR